MPDKWMIRGTEFSNCNCDWGCPCQFHAPTTHGHCEAVTAGVIEEGYFNDVRLDGLNWALLLYWPGEIAQGNGREQAVIDERANPEQREALRKIIHGESTAPGATHFFVFNSTMSEVLETLYTPIDVSIDVESRKSSLNIPDVVSSEGQPMISPVTGQEHRARINLPDGFEYSVAEVGSGSTKATGAIQLDLDNSHCHFNVLHINQDGVIR